VAKTEKKIWHMKKAYYRDQLWAITRRWFRRAGNVTINYISKS
jgi:hypothetical protein